MDFGFLLGRLIQDAHISKTESGSISHCSIIIERDSTSSYRCLPPRSQTLVGSWEFDPAMPNIVNHTSV